MKRLFALALLVSATTPLLSQAQDQEAVDQRQPGGLPAPAGTPTYQLPRAPAPQGAWQPLPQYDTPKAAVRRKAEQRSAERRARLASQRWYGHSPLRPAASPMPFMTSYDARPLYNWSGGYWVVGGRAWVMVR